MGTFLSSPKAATSFWYRCSPFSSPNASFRDWWLKGTGISVPWMLARTLWL